MLMGLDKGEIYNTPGVELFPVSAVKIQVQKDHDCWITYFVVGTLLSLQQAELQPDIFKDKCINVC